MENENNYPNGWKDGWSSADHATESYSPYAQQREKRDVIERTEKRDKIMSEYQEGLDKEKSYRDKQLLEQAQQDWRMSQIEREGREQVENRRNAINYIVQQKRDDYNKKSWLGKAIATLRGKNFDKMQRQVIADAERRVDRMSADQLERFVENRIEVRQR